LDAPIFTCSAYELTKEINHLLNVSSHNREAVNIWSVFICVEKGRFAPKSAVAGKENY